MELYIKTFGDPNHDKNRIDTENEIGKLLTQIETILFTNKGEVLGDSNFGASLEDLIYDFHYNEFEIKKSVNEQFERYCPLAEKYNVEVDVTFSKGKERDIAQLNVTVDAKYMVGVKI
jgi:phage baseplate assembly protein W